VRPGVPSIERKPLPRDVLSNVRLGPLPAPRLCHRGAGRRRLSTLDRPREGILERRGPRPRARLPAGSRFSEPGHRSPTSATDVDARTHPNEPLFLAREWDFRPATRWHQPMPVALALSRVATRRAASHALHEPACARCVPLAWTRQAAWAEAVERRSARALDDDARVLLVPPRAPGSPIRLALCSGEQEAHRSGLGPSWMPPRERLHR